MSNEIISYKSFIDDSEKKEYIDSYSTSNIERPNEKIDSFGMIITLY